MLENHQIKILMLVHELEKSLGDLYVLFAGRFPEHNNLWNRLIKEEKQHAEAVRKLYKMTYDKKALFDEGVIQPEGIQSIIDYVKNASENVKQGKFSALKAVTFCYDIERSLIERDIFTHFKVSQSFADTLDLLKKGTINHITLANKELAEIKHGKADQD